jgi:predicted nuclease of predicted toxin-antitoxin system
MPAFLIDVNLPYHFSLWKGGNYIHQTDLADEWTDTQIWNYARENDLTIISKDSDFSTRVIFHLPPPKVIHIRLGNLKMREFFAAMNSVWDEVLELNKKHKLVTVFRDRLEAIE